MSRMILTLGVLMAASVQPACGQQPQEQQSVEQSSSGSRPAAGFKKTCSEDGEDASGGHTANGCRVVVGAHFDTAAHDHCLVQWDANADDSTRPASDLEVHGRGDGNRRKIIWALDRQIPHLMFEKLSSSSDRFGIEFLSKSGYPTPVESPAPSPDLTYLRSDQKKVVWRSDNSQDGQFAYTIHASLDNVPCEPPDPIIINRK